jgi:EAL domain-containing protein (putative c-di-GMP-specific phosphodiesterase class I)
MDWPATVRVAVNVSAVQFKSRTLVQDVLEALQTSGLTAERLELEITEAVLLEDTELALSVLQALRAHGIRLSMDDFGTGYSSLGYLRRFPFDRLKIDRSFVVDAAQGGGALAIIEAITSLGRSLGMVTTAEGVETTAQFDVVRAAGCGEVQGYLFSRPGPPEGISALLATRLPAAAAAEAAPPGPTCSSVSSS